MDRTAHERGELAAGETLFKTGEPGESLYIVSEGEVELFIRDTAGQKILLAIAGKGEVFGELALLDRGPRTATAMALADTELLDWVCENNKDPGHMVGR